MRIGLVRHYKVKMDLPDRNFVTQDEITRWFEDYDNADIEYGITDMGGVAWKRCFSSDLSRASKTACRIFPGEIVKMEELREIRIYPLFKKNVTLPFLLWAVLLRIAWLLSHKSQLETKKGIRNKINRVLDRILSESEEDVLIVSHAALMVFLREELLKRGFKGEKFAKAENGKLYIFER